MDPLVIWYIQLVDKATDSLNNPKKADVLLGQFLGHPNGKKN